MKLCVTYFPNSWRLILILVFTLGFLGLQPAQSMQAAESNNIWRGATDGTGNENIIDTNIEDPDGVYIGGSFEGIEGFNHGVVSGGLTNVEKTNNFTSELEGPGFLSTGMLDVILVIDASESMTFDAGTDDPMRDPSQCNVNHNCYPFENAKDAASALVNLFNFPDDRVSIVTFDNSARVDLKFSTDKTEIQSVINNLKVVAPEICDTTSGPCREYERDDQGNIIDLDGDGIGDRYLGFRCPVYFLTGNPSTCGTTAVGQGLYIAGNELANENTFREEALRVVILLSDGAANAPSSVCPHSTWIGSPFCRDLQLTRHCNEAGDNTCLAMGGIYDPDNYDADDYARDMADFVAGEQGAHIYTIGLGDLVRTSQPRAQISNPGELCNSDEPIDNCIGAGEQLLKYAANIGGGVYYFASSGSQLDDIFQGIFSDVFSSLNSLGHWNFDENSWAGDCLTTDIIDSSGNGHHGTACINGDAPYPVSGKFGNAGRFDGINQYANMGSGFNFTSSFTASVWIALDDYNWCGPDETSQHIIGTHDLATPTGNGRGWGIYWDCDGIAWELTNSTGSSIVSYGYVQPSPFPENGSWHHTVLVYDSTVPSATLYWDGIPVYSESGIENVPYYLFNNGEPLTVNGLPYAPGAGAPGKIDDVSVYNRALSLNEIQTLFGNHPPVAINDAYETEEDTSLHITAPGLLENDSDMDGNPLSALKVTNPANGTLSFNTDGSFTYIPNEDYFGTDSFTYKVNDGMWDSDVVTVMITVNAVNDPPVANDDTGSVSQGGTLMEIAPGVLANDSDPESNILAVNTIPITSPVNGNLTLNANGSFTYIHNGSETTNDNFVYEISDGNGGTDTASVHITITVVNNAPIAMADNAVTNEDIPVIIDVLANDTDVNGDSLVIDSVTQSNNGSVTNNGVNVTYAPAANFNGTDSFSYTISDGNGGMDTANVSVTINAVNDPPAVSIGAPVDGSSFAEGAIIGFTGTASDIEDGNLTINLSWSSNLDGSIGTGGSLSTSALSVGTHTITAVVNDFGALNGSDQITITIQDTTSPVVTVPSNITEEAISTSGASVSFSVSASDSVGGVLTPTCNHQSGDTFSLGITTVFCSATDSAGNIGNASFIVTVRDTTAPSITVPTNITKEATSGSGVVVTFTVSATDLVDGSLTPICNHHSGEIFPLGITTVSCSATDAAGNTGYASFTITVENTFAPTVIVPADITKEATSSSGIVITFTVSATDLVDGSLTPTCDHHSGETFPLGITVVTCSATNTAGNTGYASFVITIKDTTAPSLAVPADITKEAASRSGAAVTFTVSVIDLVDGSLTPTCNHHSGETFPLGITTVSCSATDSADNISNASFTITVEDTTAPTVTVPADSAKEASSSSGAVVTFTVSATDLVDGSLTPTCNHHSGETFPLGITTVSCSATDAAGNIGYASFTITVINVEDVNVSIGSEVTGTYALESGKSMVKSYPGENGGPVVVQSNNGANIIASYLQFRRPGSIGGWTGITQTLGFTDAQVSDKYVFPHYDKTDPTRYNSLQLANFDTVPTNVIVEIGGVQQGSFSLDVGSSQNVTFDGVAGGPVVVYSDNGAQIVASLYELKRAGATGLYTGQTQMMGLSWSQLTDTYVIPRYNYTLTDLLPFVVFGVP